MLFAALIALAPPALDYATAAKPLAAVLADLSGASGVVMRASKAVQDDLVVVNVRGVAIESLRDRIADAIAGKWQLKDGIYTLQRNESEVDKRTSQWLDFRIAEIEKSIDDSKNIRFGFLDQSVMLAVAQEQDLVFPMHAMGEMLKRVGLRKIAAIGPMEKVVFSTKPTPMQQPMRGCEDLLEKVHQTHVRIGEIARSSTDDEHPVGSYEYRERQSLLAEWAEPLRAVVIVEGGQTASEPPSFTGYILDATGKIVENIPGLRAARPVQPKRPSMPSGSDLSMAIKMTPASRLMASLLSFDSTGLERVPEFDNPQETLELLRKPTQQDPLWFHISEALLRFAEVAEKQLVAKLTDGMVPFTKGGAWTLETVISEFLTTNEVRWTEADGWLTVSPSNPSTEEGDRRVLEDLIAGPPSEQSLGQIADFAQKSPPPWSNRATLPYFRLFAAGLLSDDPTWAWLRVYGAMSERDRLLAKDGVAIASLSIGAQKAIEDAVFFSANQQFMMGDPAALGWGRTDLTNEPTEAFPRGLPPRGMVRLSSFERPVAFIEPRPGSARPATPYSLGSLAHASATPELFSSMDMSHFRIGTQFWTNLRCELTPKLHYAPDFWTFERSADTTVYNLQTAPADFRKAYDEARARIR